MTHVIVALTVGLITGLLVRAYLRGTLALTRWEGVAAVATMASAGAMIGVAPVSAAALGGAVTGWWTVWAKS